MSDLEVYEEEYLDANVNEDNVNEVDLDIIRIVRNNPGLWDKSCKKYSNSIQKDVVWASIASVLPVKMTGTAVAKRFCTLRTIFSRNLRKVRQSQPRSGAGSDCPVYQPTWPLYQELLYLADVIKPRQTKSNTSTKSVSVLKSREFQKEDKHNNDTAEALVPSSSRSKLSQSSCSSNYSHSSSTTSQAYLSPTYGTPLQWESTFSDSNDDRTDDLERFNQVQHDNVAENEKKRNIGNLY